MRIYDKQGKQIGVQTVNGDQYFFTKEDNLNPPKDIIVSNEPPKIRKKKAVKDGNSDAG